MQKWISIVLLCAMGFCGQAGTVFQDTFDTGLGYKTNNLNYNYASRQSGGSVVSMWTAGTPAWSLTADNRLASTNGVTKLNENLAGSISGGNFTVSVDIQKDFTATGWSAFYLVSGGETNRGLSVFGFHETQTGTFVVYSGTGAQISTTVSLATLQTLISGYDATANHRVKLVSTAGSGGTYSYDFIVDGVIVLNDLNYKFGEDTVRRLEMVTSTAGRLLHDNLEISVPDVRQLALFVVQ